MMFESRSTCCGAPSLQDRDPVETGQTQVEDDGVAGFGVAEEMPFLASGPEIDCFAAQDRVILDDENSVSARPPRRIRPMPLGPK